MTDGNATKVCPMCAEAIKAAAKLCPFCRTRQSRFVMWGYELAIALPGITVFALLIAVIAWLVPEEHGVGGRNFARHRNDLVVVGTTVGRATGKPGFWLTGLVTNQGVHPWRVQELEVRFLDRQGRLLDVRHPDVKEFFVVQPRQDHGFRVELGELSFTNSDVSQQVRVQTATDGDRHLNPD